MFIQPSFYKNLFDFFLNECEKTDIFHVFDGLVSSQHNKIKKVNVIEQDH